MYDAATITGHGTVRSEWNFDDTIRGTIAGMPVELDLGAMDDEDEEWDLEHEEVEVWDGTTRIQNGTVIGGDMVGLNVSQPMLAWLITGIQRFTTPPGWLGTTDSLAWILSPNTKVRIHGAVIVYCQWGQVHLAREA
jgi:hypothetical protein